MGTVWHATIVPEGSAPPPNAEEVRTWIQAALDRVNGAMSTYLDDSDLSRLAQAAPDEPVQVSPLTLRCLAITRSIHAASGGALDPTVGPLVRLWGFGPGRQEGVREENAPDPALLGRARAAVGFEDIVVEEASGLVWHKRPGAELDLSAVAKGFGVDEAASALRERGLNRFLVEVGGEVIAAGERPGGGAWRLIIESPLPEQEQWEARVELRDRALATSGDYRNYRILPDGSRVAHTIDPRTGAPVVRPPASASVLAATCAQADGWATALSVLGEAGMALVEAVPNLEARLVVPVGNGETFRVITTQGWPEAPQRAR